MPPPQATRPPSKLAFPKYSPTLAGNGTPNNTAFKRITVFGGDTASNPALVDLDLNRCAISLQGSHTSGRNRNIVVFGVRSNNVAEPDRGVPATWQNGWHRWSNRLNANIRVQAYANALVANCRVNDAATDNYDQPGYIVSSNASATGTLTALNPGSKAIFNYTNHYGIVLGRSGPTSGLLSLSPPRSSPPLPPGNGDPRQLRLPHHARRHPRRRSRARHQG